MIGPIAWLAQLPRTNFQHELAVFRQMYDWDPYEMLWARVDISTEYSSAEIAHYRQLVALQAQDLMHDRMIRRIMSFAGQLVPCLRHPRYLALRCIGLDWSCIKRVWMVEHSSYASMEGACWLEIKLALSRAAARAM